MKLEPYLAVGGVEVANAMRTLTYLRVLNHPVVPTLAHPALVAEGEGYSDLYSDFYGSDPYPVANLACYCDAVDFGPYARPSYDSAPWWDPYRPEADEFLGARLDLTLVPAAKRGATALVRGGAVMGSLSAGPRILQAEGELYALSPAGMEYGERWLTRALAGGPGCEDDTAVVLPSCAADGFRELAGIGLVDGPVFSQVDPELPECVVELVSFQMAAGDPWLRKVSTLFAGSLEAGGRHSERVTAPPSADSAVVVTVAGGSAGDGTTIGASGDVDASYEVVGLTDEVTLDSARRRATGDGFAALDFTGPPSWLVVPAGGTMVVDVRAGSSAVAVRVERVDLEL